MLLRKAGRPLMLLLGIAALAMLVVGVVRRPGETVGPVAIEQCRVALARASTPAESTAAGRLRPMTGRRSASTALSCAVMRDRGWLR